MSEDERENIVKKEKATFDQLIDHVCFGMFTVKLVSIVGLSYIIDGSQVTVLAIMVPQSRCQWNLSKQHSTSIEYASIIGMAFGGIYWGWFADKYGRKPIILICSFMVFYFGLLTIFSNNYVWFMVLRGIVGFGVGGFICSPCYVSEIISAYHRGRVFVGAQLFFAIGSVSTAIIAILVMNDYGWKSFMALAILPIPFLMVFIFKIPETIPFLRNTGDYDSLIKTIYRHAVENKKPFKLGNSVIDCKSSDKRGQFARFLKRKYFLKLIIMCIMSFTGYFCYAGAIMQHSFFIEWREDRGYEVMAMDAPVKTKTCHGLTNSDYTQLLYASIGELLLVFLAIPLIDFLGRKKMVITLLLLNIICYFAIMYIKANTKKLSVSILVVLLILRGSSVAIIVINHLFTTELFPTVIRGSALGICAFFARISIILASLMVHVLYPISTVSVFIIFAGLCVLCSLITTLLPDTTDSLLLNK